MPKNRIDAFISSTIEDLRDYRNAIVKVLNTLELGPSGQEIWPVSGKPSADECKRKVFSSDIYIGIYAHRYGWQPDGYGGKSITEMEYDCAGEVIRDGEPIPRLCFIIDDKFDWPDDKREPDKKAELDAFKRRVKEDFVGFFTTPEDLATKVALSLHDVLKTRYKSTRPIHCNLVPPPPDHFAGRTQILNDLRTLLSGDHALAITAVKGIGGMGKTSLVKALAQNSGDKFGLMLWAELGENWREDLEPGILQTWARELANREFAPGTPTEAMARELKQIVQTSANDSCGEPILLVIDDVWPATLKSAKLLREAVPAGTRVLVTTRSQDIAVQLDCKDVTLHEMPDDEGAALMAKLIDDPRADLTALGELSHVLGGHPLSLQLAARQLRRNFQPAKVIEWTQKFREGMERGDDFADLKLDTGDSKVESVRVTLAQTLCNLSDKQQFQFRALGVLPTELSFRAAHIFALWGEEDRDGLDDLVVEGLITPIPGKNDQYTQHRVLRGYGRALLRKADELEAVEARHRDYLISLAYKNFDQPPEIWRQFDSDLPQLHALGNELVTLLAHTNSPSVQDERLHQLSETGSPDTSTDLLKVCDIFALAMYQYMGLRYIGAEGRRWLWAGLAAARTNNRQRNIGLYTGALGTWHNLRGDNVAALAYHTQSFKTSIVLNDRRGQAESLANMGAVYHSLQELTNALAHLQQALTVFKEMDDIGSQAVTLISIGLVYVDLGRKEKALDCYQQALLLEIEVGNSYGESQTRGLIAHILWDQGQRDEAITHLKKARDLKVQMGMSPEIEDGWLRFWS